MPFGLTIGTDRATALQQSIQDELMKRGYSPDADPVMAEYITIMIINNKTSAQITSELEDLIGSDFDPSFTDWLFAEAARGVPAELPAESSTGDAPASDSAAPQQPTPTASDVVRRPPNVPRTGIYQQALSQALPNASSAQKRTASARSPSPNQPNKARRTGNELPTGPRAMLRGDGNSNANSRSLLDRVGGPAGPMRNNNAPNGYGRDDIQARIDTIVNGPPDQNMMMGGGFNGMPMDMNAMAAAGMANPLMLQEMMMSQMAMMAQMASSMGMINPGFPMQGMMPGDMSMYNGGMNGFPGSSQMGGNNGNGRGRGGGRGGRGNGRGRGGPPSSSISKGPDASNADSPAPSTLATPAPASTSAGAIVAPTPTLPEKAPQQRTGFVVPERPQSPTLCKFGPKCTNAHCRYSHPSPVATAESGVVLSNEACENGKNCKDKDCIKAHVSPAALNPQAESFVPNTAHSHAPSHAPTHAHSHAPSHAHTPSAVPCRFGAACTRPNCAFAHPPEHHKPGGRDAVPCRFGAACTRATCQFQHPEGRVLPTTFHRGLSSSAPLVAVPTPETGSMGATASPHRSVTFNHAPSNLGMGVKERLDRQVRDVEERRSAAEKAVKEAEKKKEESKPVAIAA